MNDESYVGKECFYIDKTTHGKIYQNRELGVCLEETIDRDTGGTTCWFEKPFLGFTFLAKSYISIEKLKNKNQKLNMIKLWLNMFGDRDNETFSKSGIEIHNEIYHIWLQYSYDEYGYEIAPYFGYSNSDKLIPQNLAYIREEILDEIILKLKTIKEFN